MGNFSLIGGTFLIFMGASYGMQSPEQIGDLEHVRSQVELFLSRGVSKRVDRRSAVEVLQDIFKENPSQNPGPVVSKKCFVPKLTETLFHKSKGTLLHRYMSKITPGLPPDSRLPSNLACRQCSPPLDPGAWETTKNHFKPFQRNKFINRP